MSKIAAILLIGLASQTALAGVNVIYGTDDRKEVYETNNAAHRKLAQSTAGMVDVRMFSQGLKSGLFNLNNAQTLERAQNVCASEKFSQQPLAPICSGFLVGPDTLVTAGHCYNTYGTPEDNCKKFAWVFDYGYKTATDDPTKNLTINNIYRCKSVAAVRRDQSFDYAIIKLDRPVVGRQPLKFRTSGKVESSAPMMVIGHPTGLPTKIAAGGKVTYNVSPTFFSTTLDTFHGNSGSAVFNSTTGQVEGILVMGKTDYQPSIPSNPRSCQVVNKCDANAQNCSAGAESGVVGNGEVVLRIEAIAALITKAIAAK